MPNHARVDALLLRWQALRAQGQPVDLAELCRDCPELLPDLRERIESLTAATPAAHAASSQIDLILGSPPELNDEIRAILRPNLRWVGIVFLLLWMGGLLIWVFDEHFPVSGVDYLLYGVMLAVLAGLVAVTWSRRPLSLRHLRLIELALFGLTALGLAWSDYWYLHDGWLFAAIQQLGVAGPLTSLYMDRLAIPWFMLVVVYGTYIPNGWKRCATVVAGMILVPVLLTLGFALATGEWVIVEALPQLALWLGGAGALAIYGAHKINAIRKEAHEARKLGHYQLKRRLGAGGMGEVHLAEHQLLRRPCALKLIRPEKAGDARNLLRFEREVRTLATLTHWNIVSVYDYGRASDGTFYYVMEYLPGFTLEEIVERSGPLPPERVVHLLRQVCAGLREAHGRGLIHRDIKPSNVIVCRRGEVADVVKLVDFGLVQEVDAEGSAARLTQEGTVVGTPSFMSPEQIAGTDDIDARSDIYSVGAVAYYLLTGRCPFERKSLRQLFAAHLNEPVVPPSYLSPATTPDLEKVVLRCLEKKAADRFADGVALDKALAKCAGVSGWSAEQAAQWWEQYERPTV